ncbi:MAG: PLP-dependent aminotransferase family protein [Acidaminococcaceae bacterium]
MKTQTHKSTDKFVSINWQPNPASPKAMHKQIVDYVSAKVANGDWAVGSKLPPQRKLAEVFAVNRSTIISATETLKSYGIIDADYGGGTKIACNTWSLLMSAPPDWNKYIASGPFKPNLPTIQLINKLEFDKNFIRLGTGELSPQLFPQDILSKIFKALPIKISSLNYLEARGLAELRESLVKRLSSRGIKLKASNILITSGSLQALQLISVGMLKPGAQVYTETPTYLKSLQVFQSAGINFTGIAMDKSGLVPWKIGKVTNDSLLYTIPTYQNPTTLVMTAERRKEVFDFCSNHRLPILEDDAYGELHFEGAVPPQPIKALDDRGVVLYTGTISKTLAPGFRVGWLVGPESVVNRLADVKMQMDYGASSLSQWALAEIFESGAYDEYLNQLRRQLKERRDIALEALERNFSDIAAWNTPTGGLYIWLRVNSKISSDKLFQEALNKNILLNPGSVYDYKENKNIRLSFAYANKEDLAKSIEILGDIIKNYEK